MRASLFLFVALTICLSRAKGAQAVAPLSPYTAFSWAAPWLGNSPHLSQMIWANTDDAPGIIARQLAALPPGRRVLFIWHAQEQIWGDRDDFVSAAATDAAAGAVPTKIAYQSPWLEHGAAVRAAWFGPWLDGVKRAGATVDFLVTDAEVGLSMWAIQPSQIQAIAADSRFAALARKYGIHDAANVGNLGQWNACAVWNNAMGSTIASYFHSAYYAPLSSRFPGAGYTEYSDVLIPALLTERARDLNGWPQFSVGPLCGTHQSPAIYGQIRQLANFNRNDGTNPDFARDPLATIAWETTTMRTLVLGSANPILPWFCSRSWRGDNAGATPLANTPYWNELVYHAMLSGGCTSCLFWDPKPQPTDLMTMNDLLTEFQKQTNNSQTLKPLTSDAIPFNASTIVSGVQCADGRQIFRITVMPGVTSATVKVPGETIARTVSIPAGQAGVWVGTGP